MMAASIKSEKKYKVILEDFFRRIWGETLLWSHDLDHHRRVWKFAKEILPYFDDDKSNTYSDLSEKLIIACYLHDIGMSIDRGVRHGRHGRRILGRFLKENNMDETDYLDVADAIENHDKKEYSVQDSSNNVLNILSVADDLDAFGFAGIFRYSEIYLLRKISKFRIGRMIRDNARGRFENFMTIFRNSYELVTKYEKQYRILDDFFSEYNRNADFYKFGKVDPEGYCGIIDIIDNFAHKKLNYKDLTSVSLINHKDSVIKWFFNGLVKEIS